MFATCETVNAIIQVLLNGLWWENHRFNAITHGSPERRWNFCLTSLWRQSAQLPTTQRLHSRSNLLWSKKLFSALPGYCPLRRTPFSNPVRMRTSCLVPKPITTVIGLGTRLVHAWNRSRGCGKAHVVSRARLSHVRRVWPARLGLMDIT